MAVDITTLPTQFVKVEQGTSREVAPQFDVEYNFDQRLLQRKVRDHSTVIYNITLIVHHSALSAWRVWFKRLEAAGFPPLTMPIETEGGYVDHQVTFVDKPRSGQQQIAGFWRFPCTAYAERVETGYEDATEDEQDLVFNLGGQLDYLVQTIDIWPDESINGN